ncbi:MAG: long-chain fatty acid--CoA ligase, partial [Betaproteobacteria bacterium]|nr:long-chain fatty acid--CoA ligase [Betaproteobacteria bacterium]
MSTLPNAADRPWLSAYPDGVPADIDLSPYRSLVQLLDESLAKYAARSAYHYMGHDMAYAEV